MSHSLGTEAILTTINPMGLPVIKVDQEFSSEALLKVAFETNTNCETKNMIQAYNPKVIFIYEEVVCAEIYRDIFLEIGSKFNESEEQAAQLIERNLKKWDEMMTKVEIGIIADGILIVCEYEEEFRCKVVEYLDQLEQICNTTNRRNKLANIDDEIFDLSYEKRQEESNLVGEHVAAHEDYYLFHTRKKDLKIIQNEVCKNIQLPEDHSKRLFDSVVNDRAYEVFQLKYAASVIPCWKDKVRGLKEEGIPKTRIKSRLNLTNKLIEDLWE